MRVVKVNFIFDSNPKVDSELFGTLEIYRGLDSEPQRCGFTISGTSSGFRSLKEQELPKVSREESEFIMASLRAYWFGLNKKENFINYLTIDR